MAEVFLFVESAAEMILVHEMGEAVEQLSYKSIILIFGNGVSDVFEGDFILIWLLIDDLFENNWVK